MIMASKKKEKKEKEKQQKSWKKLKVFFEEKREAPKKIKSCVSFLGTAPPP